MRQEKAGERMGLRLHYPEGGSGMLEEGIRASDWETHKGGL